jgi:hypothetical protein
MGKSKGKGKGKGGGKGKRRSLATRVYWVTRDDDNIPDDEPNFCPEPIPTPSPRPILKNPKQAKKSFRPMAYPIKSNRPMKVVQNGPGKQSSVVHTTPVYATSKKSKGKGM